MTAKHRPAGRTRKFRRQRGLTLIELLVTLVLLSVLVLGLAGLWSNVSGLFLTLTLRQKAVFVLNGEMERLSALYRFTGFGADAPDSDNSASPPDQQYEGPVPRKIYPVTSAGVPVVNSIVTQNAGTFTCGANDCAALVFHDGNGAGANDDRIYVWLDQARRITARLSWSVEDLVGVSGASNCSNGVPAQDGGPPGGIAPCQELTVYLEFPFRFIDDTTPDAPTDFGRVNQMTLKTIVGRRQ